MKNLELFRNKLGATIRHYGFALSLLFAGLMVSGNMWAWEITHDVYIADDKKEAQYSDWYYKLWAFDNNEQSLGLWSFENQGGGIYKCSNPNVSGIHGFAIQLFNKDGGYVSDYKYYTSVTTDDNCCNYTNSRTWGKVPALFKTDYDAWLYDDAGKNPSYFVLDIWGINWENKYTFTSLGDGVYVANNTGNIEHVWGYRICRASSAGGCDENISEDIYTKHCHNAGDCCYHTSSKGWGIAPMYNLKLDLTSTKYGGSGTDASPYIVYSGGGNIFTKNNSTVANATDVGAEYRWKSVDTQNWTAWTQNDKEDDFTITNGAKVQVKSQGRAQYGYSHSAEREVSIYVQASAYKRTAQAYYKWQGSTTSQAGTTGGTVKLSGGSAGASASQIKKWDETTTFEAEANTANGFSFKGWYSNITGTGTALSTDETYEVNNASAASNDINIYAIFESENSEPVVLIADTAHVANGPSVTLQSYLKYTGCIEDLNEYGFKYGSSCGSLNNTITSGALTTKLKQGVVLSKTIESGLTPNTTYWYKAFVKSPSTGTNITITSEDCASFTTRDKCVYPAGDTIYYTIDASATNDDCALIYKSISEAFTNLKNHSEWWNSTNSMLKKNIVFSVVPNKVGYGTLGSRVDLSNINKFDNDKATNPDPEYEFILRSAVSGSKPLIYGLNLANSRRVTLNGLTFKRSVSGTGIETACLLIGLNNVTNNLTVGKVAHSDLKIVNCWIDATTFCCIHGQGINGLYMENNDLMAGCPGGDANANNWGASIKLMNSKNVVLLRNNFKGAHANNIFAQNVQNVVVMDNVFWNDNKKFTTTASDNSSAFIRLINYGENLTEGHKIQNIGIYYNTFYLANNDENNKRVNFLTLGGIASGSPNQSKDKTQYVFGTIDFMYNNCYSYDTDSPGRTDNAFCGQDVSSSENMKTNNFWSKYDDSQGASTSGYAFGSDVKYVNVEDQVCSTAPFNPEGLVVKGSELNLGSKVSVNTPSAVFRGNSFDPTKYYADRKRQDIRPKTNKNWTLGAYEQSAAHDLDVIVWKGTENGDWDNRNNWVKDNGDQVTCVDNLTENLKVIIPEPNSAKYGTISIYPTIPEWSTPGHSEMVRAGLAVGKEKDVTKFAEQIDIVYGGALLGTEHLNGHYDRANVQLVAGRSEWILVGSMIKPFETSDKNTTRLVVSNDYFLNFEPHVYMQHIIVDNGTIKNGTTFTSREQPVDLQSAYMIRIPDQYGKYKIPAQYYFAEDNPDASRLNDATKPVTFDFEGRYAAESALPSYTDLKSGEGTYNFVNNYYTANLDISKVLKANPGWTAKYYDYTNKSWKSVQDDNTFIKPQNGFVLQSSSASGTVVTPESSNYVSGDASYKSTMAVDRVKLTVSNTTDNTGSTVYIKTSGSNELKSFGMNETTPELYMIDGDNNRDVLVINEQTVRIPLGIRSISPAKYTINFTLNDHSGFDEVVLEDTKENKQYDLTEQSPVFTGIAKGDLVGRFYLNVTMSYNPQDGDLPTDVSETGSDEQFKIDIFGGDNEFIVTASEGQKLQEIMVTDMSGRSVEYEPKGNNYSKHGLPVADGVYLITVTTDKMSEQKKIIVKQ